MLGKVHEIQYSIAKILWCGCTHRMNLKKRWANPQNANEKCNEYYAAHNFTKMFDKPETKK